MRKKQNLIIMLVLSLVLLFQSNIAYAGVTDFDNLMDKYVTAQMPLLIGQKFQPMDNAYMYEKMVADGKEHYFGFINSSGHHGFVTYNGTLTWSNYRYFTASGEANYYFKPTYATEWTKVLDYTALPLQNDYIFYLTMYDTDEPDIYSGATKYDWNTYYGVTNDIGSKYYVHRATDKEYIGTVSDQSVVKDGLNWIHTGTKSSYIVNETNGKSKLANTWFNAKEDVVYSNRTLYNTNGQIAFIKNSNASYLSSVTLYKEGTPNVFTTLDFKASKT